MALLALIETVPGVGAVPLVQFDAASPGVMVIVQLPLATSVLPHVVLVMEVPVGRPDDVTNRPVAKAWPVFVTVNRLGCPVSAAFKLVSLTDKASVDGLIDKLVAETTTGGAAGACPENAAGVVWTSGRIL